MKKPGARGGPAQDEYSAALTCWVNAYMLRAMAMTTRGKTTMMMATGKRVVSGLVVPMV